MSERILVSGASGLIGRRLILLLESQNSQVFRLVRKPPQNSQQIFWNPYEEISDTRPYENFEAVIHLSGENIAEKRWTPELKKRILESRTITTQNLSNALKRLKQKPKVVISASAIGYYGDAGQEVVDENSQPREPGFLSEVCQAWEKAMDYQDSRVVLARVGIVLDPHGGVLKKMLPAFKSFLGSPLGSGEQWMSWVSLNDICRIFSHCLKDESLSGPVNFVGPTPVTNREFSKILAKVLHRPLLPAVPAFVLKLALGEMAKELLLSGCKVKSSKLKKGGFHHRDSNLEDLLISWSAKASTE